MSVRRLLFRTAKWAGLAAGAIALSGATFVAVENWRGRRAWRQYVDAMGGACRVPAPSVLPADRNFMKTPMLDRLLFAAREAPERKDFESRTRLWSGASRIEFGWRQGKAFDPERTIAILAESREEHENKPSANDGPPTDRLGAELRECGTLFEALVAAAAARPESELVRPAPISPDPEVKPVVAAFSTTRRLFQLLATKACNDLAAGRAEEACSAVCAGLALVRGFYDMPDAMIMDPMVGMVGEGILFQAVWDGCRRGAWNASQLARLSGALERLKPLDSLARALGTEGAQALATAGFLERTGRHYDWDAMGALYSAFGDRSLPWWFPGYRWIRGWTLQSAVRVAAGYAEIGRVLEQRESARFAPALAGLRARQHAFEASQGPYGFLAEMGRAAWNKILQHALRTESETRMARVVCGIARFRAAHGRLPESLTESAEGSASELAVDVIDGQRFRYRRDEDGGSFLLYSVGLDGKDDGGRPAEESHSGDAMATGDWCWPQAVR